MSNQLLDYPVALDKSAFDIFPKQGKDVWESMLNTENEVYCEVIEFAYAPNAEVFRVVREHSTQFKPLGKLAFYLYDNIKVNHDLFNEQLHRLEILGELEADWDGFDGLPISVEAIKNSKLLLKELPADLRCKLDSDDIDPTADGTIILQWNSDEDYFLIEMGKTKIVYFYELKGKIKGQCLPDAYNPKSTVEEIKSLLTEFLCESGSARGKF